MLELLAEAKLTINTSIIAALPIKELKGERKEVWTKQMQMDYRTWEYSVKERSFYGIFYQWEACMLMSITDQKALDENQSQAKSKVAQGTISWPLLAKAARMTEDF